MPDIRKIDWSEPGAANDLTALRDTLSIDEGQVTEEQIKRTIEAFGEPLSPLSVVRRILDEVRLRGDAALIKYTKKLDGVDVTAANLRVDPATFPAAFERVEPEYRQALLMAKANIEQFQRHIMCTAPPPFVRDGVRLETVYRPLRRVGVYVPGGAAAYPSAVLMDVIPAQVAGCSEIVVATAPRRLDDYLLAAFHILDLKEVYRVGGAQAIGMLAYGTQSVRGVDMIVGAGSVNISLAKREVSGRVKIDMYAGPSEVLVIADAAADPDFVAADLLSQAEHYPGSAILVTTSHELLAAVEQAIDRQLRDMPRARLCVECLERYGALIKVGTVDEAVTVANLIAPEHLEIIAADARALAARIENAGTVFIGPNTPEVAGDYVAGPSHTLPTGGTARFSSGLAATDFLKRITFVEYSRESLAKELGAITSIARREGLEAHARSVEWRFKQK
jgi:histidinol dehydrogenase